MGSMERSRALIPDAMYYPDHEELEKYFLQQAKNARPISSPRQLGYDTTNWEDPNDFSKIQPLPSFFTNVPKDRQSFFSPRERRNKPADVPAGARKSGRKLWTPREIHDKARDLRHRFPGIALKVTGVRYNYHALYQWFDATDMWDYGALNLFNVMNHLGVRNFEYYQPKHANEVLLEIHDKYYEPLLHDPNFQARLSNWSPRDDILTVLEHREDFESEQVKMTARSLLWGLYHDLKNETRFLRPEVYVEAPTSVQFGKPMEQYELDMFQENSLSHGPFIGVSMYQTRFLAKVNVLAEHAQHGFFQQKSFTVEDDVKPAKPIWVVTVAAPEEDSSPSEPSARVDVGDDELHGPIVRFPPRKRVKEHVDSAAQLRRTKSESSMNREPSPELLVRAATANSSTADPSATNPSVAINNQGSPPAQGQRAVGTGNHNTGGGNLQQGPPPYFGILPVREMPPPLPAYHQPMPIPKRGFQPGNNNQMLPPHPGYGGMLQQQPPPFNPSSPFYHLNFPVNGGIQQPSQGGRGRGHGRGRGRGRGGRMQMQPLHSTYPVVQAIPQQPVATAGPSTPNGTSRLNPKAAEYTSPPAGCSVGVSAAAAVVDQGQTHQTPAAVGQSASLATVQLQTDNSNSNIAVAGPSKKDDPVQQQHDDEPPEGKGPRPRPQPQKKDHAAIAAPAVNGNKNGTSSSQNQSQAPPAQSWAKLAANGHARREEQRLNGPSSSSPSGNGDKAEENKKGKGKAQAPPLRAVTPPIEAINEQRRRNSQEAAARLKREEIRKGKQPATETETEMENGGGSDDDHHDHDHDDDDDDHDVHPDSPLRFSPPFAPHCAPVSKKDEAEQRLQESSRALLALLRDEATEVEEANDMNNNNHGFLHIGDRYYEYLPITDQDGKTVDFIISCRPFPNPAFYPSGPSGPRLAVQHGNAQGIRQE